MIGELQQSEYTGANRCSICTVINIVLGITLSIFISIASLPAGTVSLGLFAAIIYLRGYLIPGTPAITKRYFPDQVHQFLNNHSSPKTATPAQVRPKVVLQRAGVIEPCRRKNDLCMTDQFRIAWEEATESLRGIEPDCGQFATLLNIDEDKLNIEGQNGGYAAMSGGEVIGRWESQAAVLADLATEYELQTRYPEWENLSGQARGYVLRGARLFVNTCPSCGGSMSTNEETLESCCGLAEVTTVKCCDCGTKLLEMSV